MSAETTAMPSPIAQDPATLMALKRRTLVLLAIVAPAVVLTVFLVLTQSRSTRNSSLARQAIPSLLIADGKTWTSAESKFSDPELEILETRDYVYRTYTDGRGAPVDLCVIFSEDNRKGTHPPDVCLEGSGLRIVTRSDRPVTVDGTALVLREIVATNAMAAGAANGRYLYFAYFYKCGDGFTPSFYTQQVQIIWNGLTRQNASGALIRYSTPMANASDIDAARKRLDELLAITFPAIRDKLKTP
jgi:EpsI family protein